MRKQIEKIFVLPLDLLQFLKLEILLLQGQYLQDIFLFPTEQNGVRKLKEKSILSVITFGLCLFINVANWYVVSIGAFFLSFIIAWANFPENLSSPYYTTIRLT